MNYLRLNSFYLRNTCTANGRRSLQTDGTLSSPNSIDMKFLLRFFFFPEIFVYKYKHHYYGANCPVGTTMWELASLVVFIIIFKGSLTRIIFGTAWLQQIITTIKNLKRKIETIWNGFQGNPEQWVATKMNRGRFCSCIFIRVLNLTLIVGGFWKLIKRADPKQD